MEMLSSTTSIKDFKLPLFGKIFKWVVPALLVFGVVKLVNHFAPTIEEFIGHIYFLGATIGIPAVLFAIYLMNKPTIDLWWLGKCKSVSTAIIKMDPISVMKGYLIKLKKKIKNMEQTILFLSGKQKYLGGLIETKKTEALDYRKQAKAAEKQGQRNAALLNMQKAIGCEESVGLYNPLYEKYDKSTSYLGELLENWKNNADSTEFTIKNKTEQFETLKAMYDGLKSIDDLTRSDSPEVQAFGESIKALEQDMAQKEAYLDDFERRSQPILVDMRVRKQANSDEALLQLEELMKDDNLKLPDYRTFQPILNSSNTQDAEFVEVNSNNKYFN